MGVDGWSLRVDHIGSLYTMEGSASDPLGVIHHATVICGGDRILYAGDARDAPPPQDGELRLDAAGCAVLPGLIDCHTHLIWSGSRREEFAMRARGASYAEVMAAGGGIRSTMRHVREASEDELARAALPRLEALAWRGVTTVEAKSGYGLSVVDELKCLRAIRQLDQVHELDILATFLGAHAIPPEFDGNLDRYVDLITEEMLPAVTELRLASFCDVFVERGAFPVAAGRKVLRRAQELGLGLRVHAEQLSHSGGARLAAELGAAAAGHLEYATPEDMSALAEAGVVCEVLPIAQAYLGLKRPIPGRRLADAGCRLAVATDLNPGSAPCTDLHLAAGLAVTQCGLTVEEALLGMTRHAASALGRFDLGTIRAGAQADFILLDSPSAIDLVCDWGANHVTDVVKRGRRLDLGMERGEDNNLRPGGSPIS